MKRKIKSIFLDFAGVISSESHLAGGYLYPNLKNFLTLEEVINRYKSARLGKVTFKEMTKGTPKELWLKHLKKAKTTPFAKTAIKSLSKNYNLFVASNHIHILFEKELELFGVKKYFKKLFISYKLKINKPHAEFYKLILKKSNSSAEESVFVDDAKINLAEAKKMGFVTIWFDNKLNKNDNRNKINFTPDYTIKSLKEVQKILTEIENKN